MAHFHNALPLSLASATIVAPLPPGVTISRSPSTSGDSQYCQPPQTPPKSLCRLRRHNRLPAVSRQTRSPAWPSAYTRSPSTVGVHPRLPPAAPSSEDHSPFPVSRWMATTCVVLPLLPRV